MTYRIHDLLKMIVPGLYLLGGVLFIALYNNCIFIDDDAIDKVCDIVEHLSSIIIFLFPFLGFIIGYIIECLMAIFERCIYRIIPRPSWVVLNQLTGHYYLEAVGRLSDNSLVSNEDASKILNKAKQSINMSIVENFYYNSVMARNIVGSQLIISICISFYVNSTICIFTTWTILILFLVFWYHSNCVYVKYIFVEYIKLLQSRSQH